MGKLEGKVALITGAGSGMGRATALLFAEEGARVTVVDYVTHSGRETTRMIQEVGGEALFVEADVSKSADIQKMIETTVNAYGSLDILHNNAGIFGSGALAAETSDEELDRILDINFKGVFLGSKYVIPLMIRQGGGVIVNTSSTGAIKGTANMAAYCGSKAGVFMLTKCLAIEYAKENIRVNCICPGLIETGMSKDSLADPEIRQALMANQPLLRLGQPENIAQAALYLACDDSVFVTGTALVVDGGATAG